MNTVGGPLAHFVAFMAPGRLGRLDSALDGEEQTMTAGELPAVHQFIRRWSNPFRPGKPGVVFFWGLQEHSTWKGLTVNPSSAPVHERPWVRPS